MSAGEGAAPAPRPGPFAARARWHAALGLVVAAWLAAAVAVAVRGLLTEVDAWLPIHLLLLGAVSTAILVWSTYFTDALLRRPAAGNRRVEGSRIALFEAGAVCVVAGMVTDLVALVIAGAALVIVAAVWHGTVLLRRLRRALPSRFGATVRYYVTASLLLPLGVGLGIVLETGDLDDDVHARVALAHVVLNGLGWMGLTVVGTLVTLWPTMLHTQVAPGAERAARRALPLLAAAVLATAGLALAGLRAPASLGLVAYLAGLVVAGRPLAQEAMHRRPSTYATWSVGLAALWLVTTVAALAAVVATAGSWGSAAETADRLALPLLVGFGAQLLLGALTYLVPVVLGGGPAVARATIATLETAARTRLVLVNAGVVAGVVPVPDALRTALWVGALAALAAVLPLLARAVLVRRGQAMRT